MKIKIYEFIGAYTALDFIDEEGEHSLIRIPTKAIPKGTVPGDILELTKGTELIKPPIKTETDIGTWPTDAGTWTTKKEENGTRITTFIPKDLYRIIIKDLGKTPVMILKTLRQKLQPSPSMEELKGLLKNLPYTLQGYDNNEEFDSERALWLEQCLEDHGATVILEAIPQKPLIYHGEGPFG